MTTDIYSAIARRVLEEGNLPPEHLSFGRDIPLVQGMTNEEIEWKINQAKDYLFRDSSEHLVDNQHYRFIMHTEYPPKHIMDTITSESYVGHGLSFFDGINIRLRARFTPIRYEITFPVMEMMSVSASKFNLRNTPIKSIANEIKRRILVFVARWRKRSTWVAWLKERPSAAVVWIEERAMQVDIDKKNFGRK